MSNYNIRKVGDSLIIEAMGDLSHEDLNSIRDTMTIDERERLVGYRKVVRFAE